MPLGWSCFLCILQNPPDWQEILTYFRGSELQNYFTRILEDNLKVCTFVVLILMCFVVSFQVVPDNIVLRGLFCLKGFGLQNLLIGKGLASSKCGPVLAISVSPIALRKPEPEKDKVAAKLWGQVKANHGVK